MFWSRYLDNPTLSVFPHDFLRPSNNETQSASIDVPLQCDFFEGLAAFAAIVYRLTGDDDIVILTNNDESDFIIRLGLVPTMTFAQLLAHVKEEYGKCASAVDYESIEELATKMAAENLAAENSPPRLYRLAYKKGNQINSADVCISWHQGLTITYNALLYRKERMEIFGEQMRQFVENVGDNSFTSVSLITPSQNTLPDPTADLDWSGYRGAIQDIFSANAKKHPERTCVVETRSFLDPTTKTRTFSYQQIDQASNVVGNYLKKTGICKGDIVMIYSHRGVDLLVAVMGILKAGATFSVIDPAYPPARQNIYLSVAKPRGLIVLEKAGELDEVVQEYISKELDVVSTIPSLRLSDEGDLGGVLAEYASYKDTPTGVLVGPDSNPTLSFTSGSEGLPKGVLGRHFSLAYYFSWMAERFGLSERDRFTMLSGIAHDPIQRDMFTPLFLGAQLLVPTADDIGTPGKLAEWMAEYGATVTHLTPAMGQLLSAQATTPIPSLHHAFFVGDILTKRDCLRLQTLAENVYIVNMYGTTETQRSVSYFEVASRAKDPQFLRSLKDVMPAGTGMKNVQLLVVNRHDRTQVCGVGEVGEIYVRAGGLAEGYRGLPDLNAEKFVTNWFVKEPWKDSLSGHPDWFGPRDRLYRTGDLGRYLPDGNVECCGRADDQVKIRGFRIELGEIDTNLSQHPSVRENITLVRKDRNDEPTLISYVVAKNPEKQEHSDPIVASLLQQTLIKDIRGFLQKRLASYAVPTVILPMPQLPLNPNGKVDKPKLPFPSAEQLDMVAQLSGSDEALTEMEACVRDLWNDVLPNRPASIGKNDSFFDLGGHSILGTRMIFELRKRLGVDVPLGVIFKEPTLKGFAREIEGRRETEEKQKPTETYYADAVEISKTLPVYPTIEEIPSSPNVFLTGGTGFLGSFLLRNLLSRPGKVFCHVRASTPESGLERLKNAAIAYGIWDPSWATRIEVVLGDLAKEKFGLGDAEWSRLAGEIDVVVHNGALVHWIYPYSRLRDANVVGTVNVMSLCAVGKPKAFSFVSSTSAIDTPHYFDLKGAVSEDDDLQGSASGLGTGYGQSKWAAEYIIREAGRRGLRGCITRPGYVTGYSKTGASNTDDFLLRMVKGCIEVGCFPDIANGVNMVPVDHVARVVVATALNPSEKLNVAHVTAHPRIPLNEFLDVSSYGYDVKKVSYDEWKRVLEEHVTKGNDSALFPLLHYVLDDLPSDTRAPELDDRNAVAALERDAEKTGELVRGMGVDRERLGVYLAYLVRVGWIGGGVGLPEVEIGDEMVEMVGRGLGGRSSAA